ncbi:MAG: hypothetical protein C4530_03895 [Desulfobacteraceae bacterium]|nr:MAG: hypothetical protein C4530_03895 [Desulfobacteraceae bacterium]
MKTPYHRNGCIETYNPIDVPKYPPLGIRDYAVYALMYQLGLRVGEVHDLDLECIDFKNRKITVMGKGRKPRTLHVNDELIEIVSQYLAVRDKFLNSWLSKALFVSKKGNRLAIRTMEDNFKKILLQTGLTTPFNVTCHTLRHASSLSAMAAQAAWPRILTTTMSMYW